MIPFPRFSMPLALLALLGCGQSPLAAEPPVHDNEQVENRGADKDDWWDELPLPEWQAYERVPVADDWFEVYRIDEDLYAIYEPGQFELVISYLIVGSRRALLFDTGLGVADMRAVVEQLTDREIIVVNSHTHYDHVGGNYQFDTVYAVDTEFTRQNAAGRAHDDVAEFVSPGWVWKEFPPGFERERYTGRPFKVSRTLRDGDSIDLGDRRFEVLATPGHAPDALCLLDRRNRLLLTGDTFYLAPLYAHFPESDFDQYEASVQRLARLAPAVDTLLMAHNVPAASSDYLLRLADAFAAIRSGDRDFVLTDGNREYDFGDFSVIVPDSDLQQ